MNEFLEVVSPVSQALIIHDNKRTRRKLSLNSGFPKYTSYVISKENPSSAQCNEVYTFTSHTFQLTDFESYLVNVEIWLFTSSLYRLALLTVGQFSLSKVL